MDIEDQKEKIENIIQDIIKNSKNEISNNENSNNEISKNETKNIKDNIVWNSDNAIEDIIKSLEESNKLENNINDKSIEAMKAYTIPQVLNKEEPVFYNYQDEKYSIKTFTSENTEEFNFGKKNDNVIKYELQAIKDELDILGNNTENINDTLDSVKEYVEENINNVNTRLYNIELYLKAMFKLVDGINKKVDYITEIMTANAVKTN